MMTNNSCKNLEITYFGSTMRRSCLLKPLSATPTGSDPVAASHQYQSLPGIFGLQRSSVNRTSHCSAPIKSYQVRSFRSTILSHSFHVAELAKSRCFSLPINIALKHQFFNLLVLPQLSVLSLSLNSSISSLWVGHYKVFLSLQ